MPSFVIQNKEGKYWRHDVKLGQPDFITDVRLARKFKTKEKAQIFLDAVKFPNSDFNECIVGECELILQ